MTNWPIVADISNYDYDADAANHRAWAEEFIAAGIAGVIVGSQWPAKALAQLEEARSVGLAIVGTYAEPDADTAIALALEFSARGVGLACERGSILNFAELSADVDKVRAAGLVPWIYGNRGDLVSIAGELLTTTPVWVASYGTNDPNAPREPITSMDFGYGPVSLFAHQYNSTIVVAGRVRDHSYYFGQWPAQEEEMGLTMPERIIGAAASQGDYENMKACYLALIGGGFIGGEADPPEPPDDDSLNAAVVRREHIRNVMYADRATVEAAARLLGWDGN